MIFPPLEAFYLFGAGKKNGKKSVNQLCALLHQPQHSVSQRLALLRKQQMVESVKRSRQVFYWIEGCPRPEFWAVSNLGLKSSAVMSALKNQDNTENLLQMLLASLRFLFLLQSLGPTIRLGDFWRFSKT